MYIRLVLKESRGDGDVVNVGIKDMKCVSVKDKYVEIDAIGGELYLFSLHNILYYRISEEQSVDKPLDDLSGGTKNILV